VNFANIGSNQILGGSREGKRIGTHSSS